MLTFLTRAAKRCRLERMVSRYATEWRNDENNTYPRPVVSALICG